MVLAAKQEKPMISKTATAVCTALVLASAFGSVAQAKDTDWSSLYRSKSCVSGDQSTTSAYPSWYVCTPHPGEL
jgi:hypothetical protein